MTEGGKRDGEENGDDTVLVPVPTKGPRLKGGLCNTVENSLKKEMTQTKGSTNTQNRLQIWIKDSTGRCSLM